MEIRELSDLLQRAGVVDAGSAGLPAHAMLEACAGTVLLNCADREPLLKTAEVLTQLYPEEVAEGLRIVLEAVGAVSGLVRIRNGTQAEAAERMISVYPHLTFVEPLSDCPAGDDEIIAGEASAPEAVILEAETAYRIARAVKYDEPVTEKFVTVSGEIAHPGVYRVPTGTTLRDLVEWANRTLPLNEVRVWLGGPMTGRPGTWDEPVTKTTNGIIVLPRDHSLFRNAGIPASVQLRRAASACDGCGRCTDLCPRSGMGYPIRPHRLPEFDVLQRLRDLRIVRLSPEPLAEEPDHGVPGETAREGRQGTGQRRIAGKRELFRGAPERAGRSDRLRARAQEI